VLAERRSPAGWKIPVKIVARRETAVAIRIGASKPGALFAVISTGDSPPITGPANSPAIEAMPIQLKRRARQASSGA
jgi:hypothetical protein